MSAPSSRVDSLRPCPDPECIDSKGHPSWAEPDQDGDVGFHVCTNCGYEFGYERLDALAVNADGACAVGIPEDVRRRASGPAERLIDPPRPPLLLQIGKRS